MKSLIHRIIMLCWICLGFVFGTCVIFYGKGSWNPVIMSWYKIQTPDVVIISFGVVFGFLVAVILVIILSTKFDEIEVKIKQLSRVEIQDLIIIVANGMLFSKIPVKWKNCNLNDIYLMKVQGFFFQEIEYNIYINDEIKEIKSTKLEEVENAEGLS